MLIMTVVLLLAVFAFPRVNGAHRWIKLSRFSIQPSELAKLTLAIFLAYFLERRAGDEADFWRTFLPAGAITAALAFLIVLEPDLGTAMMLAVLFVVVTFTAGARLRHLGMAAAPALVGLIGLLILVPWRLKRLITFLDPWADPQNSGFQVVQSLLAIGSGGPNGLGFAQGKQKMLFLPFAHSDFIFAVVAEELGLVGALAVIAVFCLILWRGLRTALLAPDRFGMLLSLGLVTVIVTQALFNISVVLSLLPTKGIPLPFISYGGSSLVPTLAAMGILLNISQQSVGSLDFGALRSAARSQPKDERVRMATGRRWATSRPG
jgi:cell division protein FtsW